MAFYPTNLVSSGGTTLVKSGFKVFCSSNLGPGNGIPMVGIKTATAEGYSGTSTVSYYDINDNFLGSETVTSSGKTLTIPDGTNYIVPTNKGVTITCNPS